jgi:alanyl-tRNA synthetase
MENRLDLMSSHTGQHILSGAFEKLYNANTVGFHLTKDNLTIDLDKKLSDIEIINSFRLANKIILENRDVIIHYPNEKELSEIPLRKQPKFSKDIRVIEIKDFDFSPCGGTHVKSTGEIGQISLKRHDIHRGGIRVEFSCSYRSLEDSFKKTNIISALIKLTSSQEEGLKSYVETMINENNSLKKELLLNKEMLLKEQFDKKYSNLQIVNNVNIFSTYDITDSKLHKTYNQIALSNNNSISAIYDKTTNKFTINRSDDLNLDIKEFINGLLSTFQIKGGGNNKQFSGSINISTLDKFHEELLNLIPK